MPDRTTPLPVRGFGRLSMPKPGILSARNGMPLYILDKPSAEICRMSIVWPAGIAETAFPPAVKMLNGLLTEGAGQRSGDEVAEALDTHGVWLRHNADSHRTVLAVHSLTSQLPAVLPVLADIICRPRFDIHAYEAVREQAASELEVEDAKVGNVSLKALRRLSYGPCHPLSRACSPADIRDADVAAVREAWLRTMRLTAPYIVLAGHVSPLVATVADWLGEIAPSENLKPAFTPFKADCGARELIDVRDATQSSVRFSWPTINRDHPDYLYLRWAVMAFGGYFGSRLMANVREDKGLTYGISAVTLGQSEGAEVRVHSQTAPEFVAPLIEEVLGELRRLGANGMSSSELARLKAHAGSELASMLDTPLAMADHYIACINNGLSLDYFDDLQDTLEKLTPEIICRVVNEHLLSTDPIIVVAGPHATTERQFQSTIV